MAAEAPLVSTRTRQANTLRKGAPLAVREGSGPVLPSKKEAGATEIHAEATGPVEGGEALTFLRNHAGMIATAGEKPRDPRGAATRPSGKNAMSLVRVVGKPSCPAGTREFTSARSSGSFR